MDKEKIVKLDIKPSDVVQKQPRQTVNNANLQTNPILKEMFFSNLVNKKGKFNFKDLFRWLSFFCSCCKI